MEPAGVFAHATAAGFIASSSGSAIVAPTPFNIVRRERCFFVMNMRLSSLFPGVDLLPGGENSNPSPTVPRSEP